MSGNSDAYDKLFYLTEPPRNIRSTGFDGAGVYFFCDHFSGHLHGPFRSYEEGFKVIQRYCAHRAATR